MTKTKIDRSQLKKLMKEMVSQSELFPETIIDKTDEISQEELEKLTITLHVALETEKGLSPEDRDNLGQNIVNYYEKKRRIYQSAQKQWVATQEAAHEAQESLFEAAILEQL